MYCYFNNGISMVSKSADYVAQDGEVLFNCTPTNAELALAFSGYADAIKEQKIEVLDAEYKSQFAELAQAYATALMANDATTAASIQTDYVILKTKYQVALEVINND
jgi:multidrug resistance efflux pump